MGGGSSKTKKVAATGQDPEAILPSATSPEAARGEAAAESSADGGSATSAFGSASTGATEGQGSASSDSDPAPSKKPKGDKAAGEGTTEDTKALASLFPGEGGTPPEAVMLWINNEYGYEDLDAEGEHQGALTWLKGALPLAHKHSKVKDWIKRLLAVGEFSRNMS